MSSSVAQAESDPAWLTLRRFSLLLGLLVLVSYPQVLLGLQTFVHRDFGYFSYPIAWHLRESFWRGELPLWNPLSNCGAPFLAQWNTQVLYPPALFYLLLPLSWSLGVFCLLHLFLAGLGMFVLARAWTRDSFAAGFAGLAFAFNGLMLNSLMWPATIAAFAWMPWVVWLTERAGREGGRTLVGAALVGALQMLSGGVEVILLTWVLAGSLCLLGNFRIKSFPPKPLLRLALVVGLVTALCAAQLLPFLDLLHHSRGQENVPASQWPMPLTGWLNFLVPIFQCHSFQGVFMQVNQFWTSSYYVGVATLALAGLAVGRWRGVRVAWLGGLTLFCLMLALGYATPIYRWLSEHFRAFNSLRFPIKFVILPVFLLPLLAAYGLAEKPNGTGREKSSWASWLGVTAAIGLLLVGMLWWIARHTPPDESRAEIFHNGLLRLFFFGVLATGLMLRRMRGLRRTHPTLPWLLLLVVWLDLYLQAPKPQTVGRAIFTPGVQQSASLPQPGLTRAAIPPAIQDQFNSALLPDATEEYISRRYALLLNCNLLDDVPKADGFFPLYLHDHLVAFSGGLTEPLLDFIGASRILVVTNNTFYWQPRAEPMPLLTAGQKPVFADEVNTWLAVTGTNFQPRGKVYLPAAAQAIVTAGPVPAARVALVHFSAGRIEAEAEAAAPAMVVVAQTYYHPWHAYVDDRPVRLWPANTGFQAFEMPAGKHQLKLVYLDHRFYLGLVISLLTLAGCLGWLAVNKCQGKPAVPSSPAQKP